jgi:NADH dehydrogenase
MTVHHLTAEQIVARPRAEVFAFFSRPGNLVRITPPGMHFVMASTDQQMRPGLRLAYRLRLLSFFRTPWVSAITRYEPPTAFVDVQERGPYARWEHTHVFADVRIGDTAGTRIADAVRYELPFGPLGDVVNALFVRRRLEAIFAHRRRAVERLLPAVHVRSEPLRVAVAGGTGFVGGAIASTLHAQGETVIVLSHRPDRASAALPDAVAVRAADVTDERSLAAAFQGVDALVISLAFPNSPMESPRLGRTFEAVDAAGTERLVAAAAAAGVRRVVYISGAGAAPTASKTWFRAKWRAEVAVRRSGIPYTIIRPTWVYGPGDVALNRFLGFATWLPFVPLTGSGTQLLAPVFVDDVARLAADALRDDAARDQVFEIGGPDTLTMREIIRVALRVSRLRRPLLPAPAVLLKIASWPLQLLARPPLTPSAVDFVNQPATVDTRPLLLAMPRRLTPLAEGLATYLGR